VCVCVLGLQLLLEKKYIWLASETGQHQDV